MEFFKRYLAAVEMWLPRENRSDIIRELSEDIHSRIEEREAALGRKLTELEEAGLLKHYGPPMLLAAQYRPATPLMGALVLPYYWIGVQVAVAMVAVSRLIAGVILYNSHPSLDRWVDLYSGFLGAELKVFGFITLLFVLVDVAIARLGLVEKWKQSWNPRRLLNSYTGFPGLFGVISVLYFLADLVLTLVARLKKWKNTLGPRMAGSGLRSSDPNLGFRGFVRLQFSVLFTVWWIVGVAHPWIIFGPGAALFSFGPVFHRFYPAIVVLGLARIGLDLLLWSGAAPVGLRIPARVFVNGGEMVLALFIVRSDQLIVSNVLGPDFMEMANTVLRQGILMGVVILAIVVVWGTIADLVAWGRSQQSPSRS